MATPRKINIIDKLKEDLLTCPICFDIYVDPRMLPCQHVLCWECLHSYTLKHLPANKFPCPTCKVMIEVPHNGLEHMQKSILTGQIEDILKLGSGFASCTYCQSTDDTDVYLCMECSKYICTRCIVWHTERTHKRGDLKVGYIERRLSEMEQQLISTCVFHLTTSIQVSRSETSSFFGKTNDMLETVQKQNNQLERLQKEDREVSGKTNDMLERVRKQNNQLERLQKEDREVFGKTNNMLDRLQKQNNELKRLQKEDRGMFVVLMGLIFFSIVVLLIAVVMKNAN